MRCPICGKPTAPDYRPFCSRRCADVDLGRWLNESYRIPAETEEELEETPTEDLPTGVFPLDSPPPLGYHPRIKRCPDSSVGRAAD